MGVVHIHHIIDRLNVPLSCLHGDGGSMPAASAMSLQFAHPSTVCSSCPTLAQVSSRPMAWTSSKRALAERTGKCANNLCPTSTVTTSTVTQPAPVPQTSRTNKLQPQKSRLQFLRALSFLCHLFTFCTCFSWSLCLICHCACVVHGAGTSL